MQISFDVKVEDLRNLSQKLKKIKVYFLWQ